MRNLSEQEVAGYLDALALIHEKAAVMSLEPRLLLQLHPWLTSHSAGRDGVWKITNYEIQERDASGQWVRVRFRCLVAVAVPQAMYLLMAEIRIALDRSGNDELLLIPIALLDFLCMHPFTMTMIVWEATHAVAALSQRLGVGALHQPGAVGGSGPRRLLLKPEGLIPGVVQPAAMVPITLG